MTPSTPIAQVNKAALALWAVRFGGAHPAPRWPLICPEPNQNGLVIVGCNPAMPGRNYYSVPVFDLGTVTDAQIEQLAAQEAVARNNYAYYAPFHRLADELGLPLEHVDLFFYRETSQEAVRRLVVCGDGNLNDFGHRQVELAVRLIELAAPRIILVANAFAGRIFKKHFGLTSLDEDGFYWVTLGGRRIPVFLSGMLAGRQILDAHSYERLVWHMKKALQYPMD